MILRNLLYVDHFTSELKDKKYEIYTFIDTPTLTVVYGTDLQGEFVSGKAYECELELKKGKVKVVSAKKI